MYARCGTPLPADPRTGEGAATSRVQQLPTARSVLLCRPAERARVRRHLNGIETFPFFAVAVVLAQMRHAPQTLVDGLAMAFLILRFAYVLAYLGNRPTLRTILWNLGFLINFAIFVLPAVGDYAWLHHFL